MSMAENRESLPVDYLTPAPFTLGNFVRRDTSTLTW
jgi:hypothetical protein